MVTIHCNYCLFYHVLTHSVKNTFYTITCYQCLTDISVALANSCKFTRKFGENKGKEKKCLDSF